MNVQWNSKQGFQRVSQGRPVRSPGVFKREQTGRISAVSLLINDYQAHQPQADRAQPNGMPTCLLKIVQTLAGVDPGTAISSAISSAAPIDYQAAPPTFRLGARSSPRKQWSCRTTELDGTRHLKARPRSVWRAQTSGRPHGQEELPLLNDSGETT